MIRRPVVSPSLLLLGELSQNSFSSPPPSSSSSSLSCRFHHDNASTLKESYDHVIVERKYPSDNGDNAAGSSSSSSGGVGIIQLHRPKALNALCNALFQDLLHATTALQHDDSIGCVVITGSRGSKAFCAGADIKEMSSKTYDQVYQQNMFAEWATLNSSSQSAKPIIAAVHGYCLGGGCELAMMCDILVSTKDASFGQPEILLGVIPGAGGTQRLVRAVGKSLAMYMILTGHRLSASELATRGLLAKVYDTTNHEDMLNQVIQDIALPIAAKGRMSVLMAKEAVNAAEELSLTQGLQFERRLFHSLFATHDQKEGMQAFMEKRTPNFQHK